MAISFGFGPVVGLGGDDRVFNLRVDFRVSNGPYAWEVRNIIDGFTYTVTNGAGSNGFIGVQDHFWDEESLPIWHFDAQYANPFLPIRSGELDTLFCGIDSAEANMCLSASMNTVRRTFTNVDGISAMTEEEIGTSNPNFSFALCGVEYTAGGMVFHNLGATDSVSIPGDGWERNYSIVNMCRAYLSSGRGYRACGVLPVLPGVVLPAGTIVTEDYLKAMFFAGLTRNLSIDSQSVIVGTLSFNNITWNIPNSFGGVMRLDPNSYYIENVGPNTPMFLPTGTR